MRLKCQTAADLPIKMAHCLQEGDDACSCSSSEGWALSSAVPSLADPTSDIPGQLA